MNIDANILTNILIEANGIFISSTSNLYPIAKNLLYSLCVIDLILAIFMHINDIDVIKVFISKILKYGFFIYLVDHWGPLLNIISRGFQFLGSKASGSDLANTIFLNPSLIASKGIEIAFKTVLQPLSLLGDIITFNPFLFGKIFIAFSIIICFFLIALQLFVTYIEFYLYGVLTLVFIPFGSNKYTSWIAQKCSTSLIAIGMKFMVGVFIAGICYKIVTKWDLPIITSLDPMASLKIMLYMLLGSIAMTICAWQIPKVVSSLFAGSGTWGINNAVGSAVNVAQTMALTSMSGGASTATSIAANAAAGSNATAKAANPPK